MSRKNRKSVARPQLNKASRELARVEEAIVSFVESNQGREVVRVGSQGSGVHRRENYRHGGKSARGGRGQGERRAIAQAS